MIFVLWQGGACGSRGVGDGFDVKEGTRRSSSWGVGGGVDGGGGTGGDSSPAEAGGGLIS